MPKKITAALLAAMMALSLTACSGGDEKQESYTGKAYESEILTPGEIVVGVSADYPPYESLNSSTGELEGFDIDMTETLATYMGAEGKEVKVVWKQMEFSTITQPCSRVRSTWVLRPSPMTPSGNACSVTPIWSPSRWSFCRLVPPSPPLMSLMA